MYKPEPRPGFGLPPAGEGLQGLQLPRFTPPPYSNPLLLWAAQNYSPLFQRSPPAALEMNLEHLHRLLQYRSELSYGSEHGAEQGAASPEQQPVKPTLELIKPEERPVSPPRMDETSPQDRKMEEDPENPSPAVVKTETEFKVADSLRESFSDPQHFQLIKHVLEGVNKNTTKRMLGEQLGEEEQYEDSLESEEGTQEERKVRVRTLISEEQQIVLKTHYQRNPKPKKEVLLEIAAQIGHPFRVVKVWFQNMRARDRREGKHVPPLSFPTGHPGFLNNNFPLHGLHSLPHPLMRPALFPFHSLSLFDQSKSPESGRSDEQEIEEEDEEEEEGEEEGEDAPLDLSNKGSTPGTSPDREDLVDPVSLLKLHSPGFQGSPPCSSSEEDGEDGTGGDGVVFAPTQCPHCSKVFTKRSSFTRHVNDHSGEFSTDLRIN